MKRDPAVGFRSFQEKPTIRPKLKLVKLRVHKWKNLDPQPFFERKMTPPAHIEKKCIVCGTTFMASRTSKHSHTCCSARCGSERGLIAMAKYHASKKNRPQGEERA